MPSRMVSASRANADAFQNPKTPDRAGESARLLLGGASLSVGEAFRRQRRGRRLERCDAVQGRGPRTLPDFLERAANGLVTHGFHV